MAKSSESSIRERLVLLGILLCIFFIFHLMTFIFSDLFSIWDFKINDQLYKLRYKLKGKEKINPGIVHVDLNETSLQNLKFSVYDRSIYARIINVLTELKVAGIVFDIIFPESRDKKQDDLLIQASVLSGKVYYPVVPQASDARIKTETLDIDPASEALLMNKLWHPRILKPGNPPEAGLVQTNFNELTKSAKGIGSIAIDPDIDSVYRRIPMLYKYKDGFIPSITLSMICNYLSVNSDEIEVNFGEYIIIKKAHFPLGSTKTIRIPIDSKGCTIVNFAGLWNDTYNHYSFEEILNIENNQSRIKELSEELENNFVIISDITIRGKDHGTAPFEKVFPLSGLHSNLLNSILTGNFISQLTFIKIILIALIFMLLIWILGIRLKAVAFVVCASLVYIIFLAFNILLFVYFNTLATIIPSTLSFIISLIAVILFQYFTEQKKYIAHILELNKATTKFVPSEFLHYLQKDDIIDIALGNQTHKEMAVLFSDIRSFTTISEKMTPKENFDFLNSYLSRMGPIIREHGGFIDKYIGDAIMALFPESSENAVKAGIAMRNELSRFNSDRIKENKDPIKIGIGINTGNLMLGIIGERERFEGTVIADAVNLASRLEGLTKHYGVGMIISESVLNACKDKDQFTYRFLDFVIVKGKKEPVSLYEVLDGEPEESKRLKLELRDQYKNAFELYVNKDFKKASSIFQDILNKNPKDFAVTLFIDRCEKLDKLGVSKDWKGAEEFLEK